MRKSICGSVAKAQLVLVLMTVVATASASRSPLGSERARAARSDNTGKLRVIAFGAHPDDCEIKSGGVAAMWAAQGHHVKFVSTTNGDIGHWKMAGGPLAKRRTEEVQKAAEILNITTEVLTANKYRDKLIELYGEQKGTKVRYAEAFELCEYGRGPSEDELRTKLFPFFEE